MAALEILWEVDTTTARNALVVKQLEIGNWVRVRAGSGALYQAIAAGSGASCWSANQADDDTRLDAAEAAIVTLGTDLDTAEAAIVTLDTRLDTAEPEIDTLQTDLDAAEATIVTHTGQISTAGTNITALQAGAPSDRAFGLVKLPITTGLLLVSDVAYWVYLGYLVQGKTFKRVRFHVVTAAVGTQVAEVALASSPTAPNRASQVLTKLAASGALGDLTGTGLLGNSSDLNFAVPAGTHLWAGIRTAFDTTQPTLLASANDFGQGTVLSTATAGALTDAGPWTGATIAHALTAQAPILVATLD